MSEITAGRGNQMTCFNCLSLEGGAYLIGVYSLVSSILYIIINAVFYTLYLDEAKVERNLLVDEKIISKMEAADLSLDTLVYGIFVYWLNMLGFGLWIFASITLLIGISKRIRCCLTVWIRFTILFSLFLVLRVIHFIIHGWTIFNGFPGWTRFVIETAFCIINLPAARIVECYSNVISEETPTSDESDSPVTPYDEMEETE